MVGMSETTNSPTPIEVPVRTKGWQSMVMVVCAGFMCLAQTAFAAQRFGQDSAVYVWMVFCMLVAFAIGFLLLARSRYPRATFVAACVVVLVFPYDPILALMALTALLARRNDMKTTVRAIVAGGFVTLAAQVRDALRPPEASIWHMVFAKPDTGSQYGTDIIMLADDRTIVITAIVAALLELAIATLAGLHIRSRALASLATAEAGSLDAGQLAGQASRIADKTEEIRKQAAGALDEAHSVIDMLRHPEQAKAQLAPSDETSLTRESLDALLGDARAAGMRLNTWIDIQQLGQLNRETGKIAYRVLQEGLTNASRHAPGAPVSVELTVNPTVGVHAHVSNPTNPSVPAASADATRPAMDSKNAFRTGAGLPGLAERVRQAGGTCRFGFDARHAFHVDVQLPWVE